MQRKPYKFSLVSKALGPISTQKLPHGLMLSYEMVIIINSSDILKFGIN
jgi:hypothetical protein